MLEAVAVMKFYGRYVYGVGFCCESCWPMLGACKNKNVKILPGFSQVMEVYSVFVGLVTQLSSPSNVCVCGA